MNWNDFLNYGRDRDSEREKDRKVDPRNEFESDFGRVIFSPATRRMHDKTQVFPLTTDDNIHSRLTHSMEVMAIGHSLGLRIVENEQFLKKTGLQREDIHRNIPVILKNACLVHDIGNPPFGHFGETVIASYFEKFFNYDRSKNSFQRKDGIADLQLTDSEKKDFIFFDGNAQGLRVLTKLQVLNDDKGLNLTFATLGAFIKYPNAGDPDQDKNNLPFKKRGVFQSEIKIFEEIVNQCGLRNAGIAIRHPLAFLMEAADSICYLVMDMEDSFNKGWYTYDFIASQVAKISETTSKKLEELSKINGEGAEITKMVKLRIHLISELVKIAVKNFVDNLEDICVGAYKKELIHDDSSKLADTLAKFSYDYIFPKRDIQQLELTGHSVITGLLNYYIDFVFYSSKDYRKRAEGILSNSTKRAALIENKVDKFEKLSDYYKLRAIVDYISGMTDQFALNQYQKLSGQKI